MLTSSESAPAWGGDCPLWRIVAASVTGPGHLATELPCQDAWAIATADGGRLIAVLCDGAGSAAESRVGAQIGTQVITEVLASTRLSLPAAEEGELTPWRDAVANAVTEARTQLAVNLANDGGDLSAFHATLVGVIAAPEGGILFHIGDGAAVACETLGDWCRCVVSGPQNGEYANETAFFTLDRWRDNLRLKPFGPSELIVLMSDGSMPFVVAPDLAGLEQRFIEPVSHHLNQTDPATAAEDLVSALDAAPARAISKDDKTLLWARLKTDCDEDAIPPH